jgi:hypothetical protein
LRQPVEDGAGLGVARVQAQRGPELADSFVIIASRRQGHTQVGMGIGVAGIEVDRTPEMTDRAGQVAEHHARGAKVVLELASSERPCIWASQAAFE